MRFDVSRPGFIPDLLAAFYWKLHYRASVDGCRFSLRGLPPHIRRLLVKGKYEARERQALKYLNPELPTIELGACLGVVACITNKLIRDPTNHVVLEANPFLRPVLEHHRALNSAHFEIVSAALAYGTSEVELAPNYDIHQTRVGRSGPHSVSVKSTTLRSLLAERNFHLCNLIADIEGHEVQLVDHEIDVIKANVACMIVETHPQFTGHQSTSNMLTRLQQVGFKTVFEQDAVLALVRAS